MASGEVYGVQAFTAGSDTELAAFDASFTNLAGPSGGAVLTVRASDDTVRQLTGNAYGLYQLSTGASDDLRVIADILMGTLGITELWCRMDSNGDGYAAMWGEAANPVRLYRITGNNVTYTQIDSFGNVAASTTYTNCYIEAITRADGSVQLRYGDNTNGMRQFIDTASDRHLTGTAGVGLYNFTAALSGFDNVRVRNLAPDARQSTWSLRRGITAGRR